jgi:hypothetical protein
MADRCLGCHTDVRRQLDRHEPLHGLVPDGMQCRSCHSEHNGPHGALTSLDRFDHDFTAFKLTGKHQAAACGACHSNNTFKGTPQDCVACHAEPKVHRGRFGTACAQCHSTDTWTGGSFKHVFPLNHGRRGIVACVTCHPSPASYRHYTCYGCHAHQPAQMERRHARIRNLVDLLACARCHPTGREHRRAGGR